MATKFAGGVEVGRADYQIFPPESLDKIQLGVNLRDEQDYGDLEQFARELFDPDGPGQLQPGVIRKSPDGQPVLVAGFRRLAAIRLGNSDPRLREFPSGSVGPLGFKAITIRCNEDEALLYNLAENRQRQDLSPVSLAKAARILVEKGWTQARVAKALGISGNYVGRLLNYLDLPQEARHALHVEIMPQYLADSLRGLPEKEIKEVVKEIEGGAKPSDVKRKIDQKKRTNGVRVSMTQKEIMDIFKAKEKEGSWIAADFITCFQGQHVRSLPEMIDLYDQDPEALEAHQAEYEKLKERAARTDQLEVELETVLNWIANNLGDDTRDLAEKELQQARELAQALAGIEVGIDQEAGAEAEAGAES